MNTQSGRPKRVMLYVQHLMGIGHQRRAAAISRALVARGMEVLYVSGGYPVPHLDPGAAGRVQLPPARSPDMLYRMLVDEHGHPVDDAWKAHRRALLLDTFADFEPDALVIETYPFGRRLLRFELVPLLDSAAGRARRPVIAGSVRDVLERWHKPGRNEAIVEQVLRYFDFIMVHSDPRLITLDQTFPLAGAISERLRYTGYVMDAPCGPPAGTQGRGEVIVSAGGGFFGEHVLRAAMEARARSRLAARTWRILAGPHLDDVRFAALRAGAPVGVVIERNRGDFSTLLANCAISVSQGGYNTVLEVLHSGARAVIVPYADEREKEQAVRARLLSGCVPLRVVANDRLTPQSLAEAVDRAARGPAPQPSDIDTGGAAASARLIAQAVSQ